MALKEVTASGTKATYVKFTPETVGQQWRGVYTGKTESKKFPGNFTYYLQDGESVVGLPGNAALKKTFDSKVPEGTYAVVTYLGTKLIDTKFRKGVASHQVKVEVDDAQVPEGCAF